jgi:hypothetical protein
MHPDPFIEQSPLWAPYKGPPDADFAQPDRTASDLYAFLRQHSTVSREPEATPQLPKGVYLQQTSTGWALFVPSGSAGYVRYDGDRQQLIEMASRLTTI